MRIDRDRFLLLVGALTACHEARENHPAAVTLEAIPTPPPHALDFCESITHANELVLANPPARHEPSDEYASCPAEYAKEAPALLDNPEKRPPFLTYCHRGKGGTWAVVVVSVSLDDPGGEAPPCGWSASYKLIHVRDENKPAEGIATPKTDFIQWANESDDWTVAKVFDFDNDGQDEIVLSRHEWSNGGGVDGSPTVSILRAGSLEISPYAVGGGAQRITAVIDVDHDGRPDLVQGFFRVECPGGLAGFTEYGAPLLLHSLADGTFSASDEVARRWAITQCPALAPAADFRSATCQRIWGRPVDAIGKELTKNGGDCSAQDDTRAALAAPLPFKALNSDTPTPYPIKPFDE